jgi:hypothetical protein
MEVREIISVDSDKTELLVEISLSKEESLKSPHRRCWKVRANKAYGVFNAMGSPVTKDEFLYAWDIYRGRKIWKSYRGEFRLIKV